jgi:hypothetical protein
MRGWTVAAFPEQKIFNHRHTGAGDNIFRHIFRQGRMDYAFGSNPMFEIFKCLRRFAEKPYVVGGTVRLLGFFWACARRDTRPVSAEFIAFLRREQKEKMTNF